MTIETAGPTGHAPAAQNCCPTWTSASKDAVGTALGTSRLWFSMAAGIITEVYYPRADIPQLKDLGFIVADEAGFWVEVRRHGVYTVQWHDGAIPAIEVLHRHSRFSLQLRVCVDPDRDVLLVDFQLSGAPQLQLHVLAAPRIGGDATRNEAWAGEWAGHAVLWAEQGPFGLALAAVDRAGAPALRRRSVGSVGVSDGWQDFARHGDMRWHYAAAGPGEVALTGRLTRAGTIALGLSSSRESAATLALQSLATGFAQCWRAYCEGWHGWLQALRWPAALPDRLSQASLALVRRSAAVIKCHEDRSYPGALVASLSVPWGETSSSRGGYHLVWARDLVEAAGALVVLGCHAEGRRILGYLIATQQSDGHWFQNQWIGGKPFWQGIQLDETAFPVLLAAALAERDALDGMFVAEMVRRAVGFIARRGPATEQDRWEEETGVNTFTLAVTIAALVEGSRFLEPREAECALMLADAWNQRLEDWTWAPGTRLAREIGVAGFYMRTAPEEVLMHDGAKHRPLKTKNRVSDAEAAADERLAIDCLQLARFGLRSPDDPKMIASLRAIDTVLKSDTPLGPVWHRYNGDGYGEHPDGTAFDGWGRGRGWPLLTGERGHVALLAGEDACPYLEAMTRMVGPGGLLPEQVWDSTAIPEHGLYPGRPSGSAMPLVWSHAEFIKLAMSTAIAAPADRPSRTWERYRGARPILSYALWQPHQRAHELTAGQTLRLFLPEPARVRWGTNGWLDPTEIATEDWGLGHLAQLPTARLLAEEVLNFTIYWLERSQWCGENYHLRVVARAAAEPSG